MQQTRLHEGSQPVDQLEEMIMMQDHPLNRGNPSTAAPQQCANYLAHQSAFKKRRGVALPFLNFKCNLNAIKCCKAGRAELMPLYRQ
jgi:hypothetical protein